MALTKLKSEGIKDGEVKNADMADDAVGVAELSATGTASSSTFLRGDNSWAIPTDTNTVTTINNNADNRIITGSGTASTLEGEANLTYDGSHLSIATDASTEGIKITSTGNTYNELSFDANRTSAGAHIGRIVANWDGTAVSYISMDAGDDTTNKDDGIIRFWTAADGNGNYERMRIDSSGKVGIGDTSPQAKLHIQGENTTNGTVFLEPDSNKGGNISHIHHGSAGNWYIRPADASGYIYHDIGKSQFTNGILFGSDTAAANTLDDYEEGTFTPTFANVDNSVITVNHYNYTKIGRLVHFEAKFTVGSNNDGSAFGFTLPFTQAGSRETVIPAISTRSGSNTAPFAFVVNANQSYCYGKMLDGYGDSETAYSTFAGDIILVSGTYEAA